MSTLKVWGTCDSWGWENVGGPSAPHRGQSTMRPGLPTHRRNYIGLSQPFAFAIILLTFLRELERSLPYEYQGTNYDRLQIRTAEDLLAGRVFDTPSKVRTLGHELQPQLPMSSGLRI